MNLELTVWDLKVIGTQLKVSYSSMNNVRSIITNHNTRIIRKSQTQVTSADNCNCRNKEACHYRISA